MAQSTRVPAGAGTGAGAGIGVVDAVRLSWGVLLLSAPRVVLRAADVRPTSGSVFVVRMLGGRHLAQAVLNAACDQVRWYGAFELRRAGAAADLLHAASAIALAASGRAKRAWMADAGIAACFGAATWRGTRRPTATR